MTIWGTVIVKLKNTHVYAHAAWLDRARQDGVGHGGGYPPRRCPIPTIGSLSAYWSCSRHNPAKPSARRAGRPRRRVCCRSARRRARGTGRRCRRGWVGAVEHADPCLRGAGREHFARGMVGDYTRDGGFEVSPHQEERRPREELRDAQPHHHAGTLRMRPTKLTGLASSSERLL